MSTTSFLGRRRTLVIGGSVVLAVALVGAILWFLGRSAPEEVSIDDAVGDLAGSESPTDTAPAITAGNASGDWVVDTTIGTFDIDAATSSFAGFRVAEELTTIGSATAVGRTPDVSGSLTLDGTTLTAATFEVDLTTIVSNDSRRNSKIQGALETSEFPTATFVLTEPVDVGSVPTGEETVDVTAVGELTIHGITQPVEVSLQAATVGDVIAVTGSVDIQFGDYGVTPPSAPIVVSVSDTGTVEWQLFLTRA